MRNRTARSEMSRRASVRTGGDRSASRSPSPRRLKPSTVNRMATPGEDREVRRGLEEAGGVGQHRPPLRLRRVGAAEAEEAETRRFDDRRRQRQRGRHDQRGDGVREHVHGRAPAAMGDRAPGPRRRTRCRARSACSRAAAGRRPGCWRPRSPPSAATGPGPSRATSPMANRKLGNASITSTTRIIVASMPPPK